MAEIAATGRNDSYLPGIQLPTAITATSDLAEAIDGCAAVLVVTPSHAFAETLLALKKAGQATFNVAWATKGFDPESGRFLHEVAADVFPDRAHAVITGPSFAKEVAMGLPTAVTVHSDHAAFAMDLAQWLHSSHFRAYTGSDVIGAELGGAMKNVLAVATGVIDGMGLGLNARAGLVTRGLNEMLRLNRKLGGKSETIMGLAGVGDLVLTCTGDLSRNRRLGLALGKGKTLEQAIVEIGQVIESIQTVNQIMVLGKRHGVDLPISEQVQKVLSGEITPAEGMKRLLAREQKAEF